jgi:hypothetical protein
VLAELGVIGFAVYLWLLAAAAWALVRVTRIDRALGLGLSAVLLVVFVHALLYAGFFEDPLTWGALALAAAVLAAQPAAAEADAPVESVSPDAPRVLAH